MTTNIENKVYDYNHVEPTEEDPLKQDVQGKLGKDELTFREKVSDVFANITVEPCLFLFVTATMLNIMSSQNLQLEKACRVNLNFSTEICDSLKIQDGVSQNEYERETQKLLARALTWRTYLTATIPCIFAFFVGSFSDKTGHRKIFMIIPIIGQFLVCINNMFNVYFFYQIYLEVMILTESIIEGLSGSWCICFMTAFAYISTITTNENRTFRMGLLSFCITVAFPIGMGASGILLKKLGYYGVYGIAASIYFLDILYVIFMVNDPKRTSEQKKHDRKGFPHLFSAFFNIANVKDTVSVVVKDAPNNRRVRIIVFLSVITVLFGPMYGEISIMYMSVRYRFGWDEVKYSFFQTYNFIAHSIGTTFSILVLTKYLGWHDSLLGIVSTLSKIASSFIYCFAQTGIVFYIGPLVEILNGTSLLAMRSILSKMVEPDELGKLSSLIGLVENLMPLIYVPMYLRVYSATMEVLPGAVFMLGALLTLPAVGVLCWLFYEHRKEVSKLKSSKSSVYSNI